MSPRGKVGELFWPDGFAQFWDVYPRRVAKQEAQVAWTQLKPTQDMLTAMLDALEWQCRTTQWTRQGGEFVPYAATWIRGRRWEDEPPQAIEPFAPTRLEDRWICNHEPYCGNRIACGIVTAREKRSKAS